MGIPTASLEQQLELCGELPGFLLTLLWLRGD